MSALKKNVSTPQREPRNYKKGARNYSEKQILKIRAEYESGKKSAREISEEYGMTTGNVYLIVNRRTWKHI